MVLKLNRLNRRESRSEKEGKTNKIKVSSQIDRLDYQKIQNFRKKFIIQIIKHCSNMNIICVFLFLFLRTNIFCCFRKTKKCDY